MVFTRRFADNSTWFAYVQTLGEFEALISMLSAVHRSSPTVVYMPVQLREDKVFKRNIRFICNISKLEIDLRFARFWFVLLRAVMAKVKSQLVVVPINIFDQRHSLLFRLCMAVISNFMIRDAIQPHEFPPYEGGDNFFTTLLLEDFAVSPAYERMNVAMIGVSPYYEALLSYLRCAKRAKAGGELVHTILIISKNVREIDVSRRNEYMDVVGDFCATGSEKSVRVLYHPRESVESRRSAFEEATHGFYQEVCDADIVIAFGGSSGWLYDFCTTFFYVDDPIFNRGSFGRKRFKDIPRVLEPKGLGECLANCNSKILAGD